MWMLLIDGVVVVVGRAWIRCIIAHRSSRLYCMCWSRTWCVWIWLAFSIKFLISTINTRAYMYKKNWKWRCLLFDLYIEQRAALTQRARCVLARHLGAEALTAKVALSRSAAAQCFERSTTKWTIVGRRYTIITALLLSIRSYNETMFLILKLPGGSPSVINASPTRAAVLADAPPSPTFNATAKRARLT